MSGTVSSRMLTDLLREHAARAPEAPLLVSPTRPPASARTVSACVDDLGRRLRARGLGRQDTVAVVLADAADLAVAVPGVSTAAVCAPLDPAWQADEFARAFDRLEARALLVVEGSGTPAVEVAAARGLDLVVLQRDAATGLLALPTHDESPVEAPAPADVMLALQTSGTTGTGRVVRLSHANVTAATAAIASVLQLSPEDRCLLVMPLFHIHGLSALFATLATGGTAICPPRFTREDAGAWLRTYRPTWYTASPTIHRAMLAAAQALGEMAGGSLRFVRSASAPLPHALAASLESVFGVPVIEAYGLTEAAPQVASNRLPPARRKPGSVGAAAGTEIGIRRADGSTADPGEPGEVVVRGPNVCVEGWLRTGDLGVLDADGDLYITGRLVDVINQGGEKIAPDEVEAALLATGQVVEAVAFGIPHRTLGESVAAAVVPRDAAAPPGVAALRDAVAARLAAYKVPHPLLILDAIPVGPSGKVTRRLLAGQLGLDRSPLAHGAADAADADSTVARVARVLARALGVGHLGPFDDFFLAGGDSLAATQAILALGAEFDVTLPPDALVTRPTAAELAALLDAAADTRPARIGPRADTSPVPLSAGQLRLWLIDRLEPGDAAYTMQAAVELSGPLDVPALERALTRVRARHAPLRTTIAPGDPEPTQVVHPAGWWPLPRVDLSSVPAEGRRAECLRLVRADAGTPFHLERGPLVRTLLVRESADRHVLVVTVHHIVSDGWSTSVLLNDLAACYEAETTGRPPALPALPLSYLDVATAERRTQDGEATDAHLAYWRHALDGWRGEVSLPSDRPRPARATRRGARWTVDMPPGRAAGARRLASLERTTPFVVFLSAFEALLHRLSDQDDIGVGTPVANRRHPGTEHLVGFFANTLVLRVDVEGDPSFRDLVARTRSRVRDAFAHQAVPFDQVVDAVHPARRAGRTPLFNVMFAFQQVPPLRRQLATDVAMTALPLDVDVAKFDLTLYLSPLDDGGVRATWQYSLDLFDLETVRGFAQAFEALLDAATVDPSCRVSALPLARHGAATTAGVGRPPTTSDFAPADSPGTMPVSFLARFEEHVARGPEAVAISGATGAVTYGELDRQAWQVVDVLRRAGVGPGAYVGVALPRSPWSVAALLGIWRARGVYVPLDITQPVGRLGGLVEDTRPAVVLTAADTPATLASLPARLVPIDGAGITPLPDRRGEAAGEDARRAVAYVVYTSGTAGHPKGVALSHANVAHYLAAMAERLGVTRADRWLHTASVAFSSSVRQFLLPLWAGGTVVLASHDEMRDPSALRRRAADERVTVLDLVPSYWREVIRWMEARDGQGGTLWPDLRLVLSASEPLDPALPTRWRALGSTATIVNMYGQTETTGIVSTYVVPAPTPMPDRDVPVGQPIRGMRASIVDTVGRPVPAGVAGELVVEGPCVGLGYVGGTAAARVLVPLRGPGAGRYATGDRARMRLDGTIVLLGRADQRIKVRGHRVEPADIEGVLARHPGVGTCLVASWAEAGEATRLVALVVATPSSRTTAGGERPDLRAYLRERLPDYMVPAHVFEVADLPRTPNGKLDRTWRDRARVAAEVPPAAPTDLTPTGVAHADAPRVDGRRAEQILTDLWARLLGADRVGRDDNFFELGGDSLVGLRMIDEARRLGLALTPAQLFQHQTIAELARVVEAGRASGERAAAPAVHATPAGRPGRITIESARAYGVAALSHAGLPLADAERLTEVQVEASLRGQPTHNIGAIPRYARRVASGVINPHATFRVDRDTPSSARLDADNGAGQLAALAAMDLAIRKATRTGIGIVGVFHSNHFGAAGHYVWLAARSNLIGLCTTNSALWLAPTGGLTPLFGTNPLGVGIPAGRHHPIVLDVSMSATAKGKVALQLAEGRPLQPGWILDRRGRTSIDPADLVAGLGVPIGGHKGYGLALVMEILSGVLTGAGFGSDHRRERMARAGERADFGHFFMAIDPDLFLPRGEFSARVDRLIDEVKGAERVPGVAEILLPGEAEMRAREENLRAGIPLSASVERALLRYRDQAGFEAALQPADAVGAGEW